MKSTFFFLQIVACTCNRCRVKTDGHAVQIFREYSSVITHAFEYIIRITVQGLFKMEVVA